MSDGGTVNNLALETETVWDFDVGSNKLLGAFNVAVGGTLWDVVFRDVSRRALHLNQTAVNARTLQEALDFSFALDDQVLVDGWFSWDLIMIDTWPYRTNGCELTSHCIILTPHGEGSDYWIKYVRLQNSLFDRDEQEMRAIVLQRELNTRWFPEVTMAVWSQRVTIEVATPSTISILALGLIGLATRRFKKQS